MKIFLVIRISGNKSIFLFGFNNCNSITIVFKVRISFFFKLVFGLCENMHLFGRASKEIFLNETVFSCFLKEIVCFCSPSCLCLPYYFEDVIMGFDNPYESSMYFKLAIHSQFVFLISSFMALRRYVLSSKREDFVSI